MKEKSNFVKITVERKKISNDDKSQKKKRKYTTEKIHEVDI